MNKQITSILSMNYAHVTYYVIFIASLSHEYAKYWQEQIRNKPVENMHSTLTTEKTISKSYRSLMTQLRLGILPLGIETGRFTFLYDKSSTKEHLRFSS